MLYRNMWGGESEKKRGGMRKERRSVYRVYLYTYTLYGGVR